MGGYDKSTDYGGGGRVSGIVGYVAAIFLVLAVATCSGMARGQSNVIVGMATSKDGDDLIINGQDVRLHGFDAPERPSSRERRSVPCGDPDVYDQATHALSAIVVGQTVNCRVVDHHSHNRPVADCTVGGRAIGDIMVSQGWARDWPRYSHGRYAELERQARAAHRGVWAETCPGLWGNRNYN